MTWEELATSQHAAALYLFGSKQPGLYRAVCGRAYYAVYALLTSRLPTGISFEHNWQNPSHARLPGYVDRISGLRDNDRRELKRALRRLRSGGRIPTTGRASQSTARRPARACVMRAKYLNFCAKGDR